MLARWKHRVGYLGGEIYSGKTVCEDMNCGGMKSVGMKCGLWSTLTPKYLPCNPAHVNIVFHE